MVVSVTPAGLAILVAGIFLAGALNGVAGFGFAVIGTMALATVIEPGTAVVFMIAPILAVNLSLIRELSPDELYRCTKRFAPLIAAALFGTLVGLVVVDRLPAAPLRIGLGVVALGFVATVQRLVPLPGLRATKDRCFVETPLAMVGVGGISGLLFGGTNVGVQVIAYLRSCDLSHGTFVGVVAMVFLGLNAIRIAAAGWLGMYAGIDLAMASGLAMIPAVAGVAAGKRLRPRITDRARRSTVLGLLTLIGVRLVTAGFGFG